LGNQIKNKPACPRWQAGFIMEIRLYYMQMGEVASLIYIGLTGWGDHDSLYTNPIQSREKLKSYAGYFPIVEVDSAFYALYTYFWRKNN